MKFLKKTVASFAIVALSLTGNFPPATSFVLAGENSTLPETTPDGTSIPVKPVPQAAAPQAQPAFSAADAARAELQEFYQYTGPVNLKNFQESPLSSPVEGVRGTYKAEVDGTDWIAWGVVASDGSLIHSGLAKKTDSSEAIPLIARELANFWTGKRVDQLFQDLNKFFYNEQQGDKLSEEIRLSSLRGILDIYHANPTRFIGFSSGMLSGPFQIAFSSLSFSDRSVEYLSKRIFKEWDPSFGDNALPVAFNLQRIFNALLVRANQREEALPLLRDLVDAITARDRSRDNSFEILLDIVAQYHLSLATWRQTPHLLDRKPEVLLNLIRQWVSSHAVLPWDPFSGNNNGRGAIDLIARICSELRYLLTDPDLIHENLSYAQQAVAALFKVAVESGTRFAAYLAGYELNVMMSTEFFKFLDEQKQNAFIDLSIANVPQNDPSTERILIRSLISLLRENVLTEIQKKKAKDFLTVQLPSRIQAFMAEPVPGLKDPYDHEEQTLLIEIAKGTDQKSLLDPLLEKFITPFKSFDPGNIPDESAAAFEDRRQRVLRIWH